MEIRFSPSFLIRNPHIQTIVPAVFRKLNLSYERERLELDDGDFIDLDWSMVGSNKIVLLLHGFEGDADTQYVKGCIKKFNEAGWDGVGMNYRGCSGELNRKLHAYHSGFTQDVDAVIQHLAKSERYDTIAMIGFSMGGNMTIKYLGEGGWNYPKQLKAAVAFSVPTDLKACALHLSKLSNRIYLKRFLNRLNEKIRLKEKRFEEAGWNLEGYHKIPDLRSFDDRFTAPLHGFSGAEDYWQQCRSDRYIEGIRIPTLLINAQDDPFLTKTCFPTKEADANPNFKLSIPRYGGHVGFWDHQGYKAEDWAIRYITKQLSL